MNNFNFNSYDTSQQAISYCEVDKCPAIIKLKEQLEAYKMEAEEGKKINAELKAEQNKIKTICDNHFDEYEMGCLDLSDAIESLLERYDNAITGLTKQRKELKAENDELTTINARLLGRLEVDETDTSLVFNLDKE